MKNYSIWLDNNKEKVNPKLNKNLDVDVLIIGGGITGLSIATNLINANLNVALVEKNEIGHGVTAKTTGKLTFLQETIYTDIKNTYDFDTAKLYFESQADAIKIITERINKYKIECNYEKIDSFIYTNKEEDINKIKEEKEILEQFNVKVKETNKFPDNTTFKYGISVSDTGVFHPLKYLRGLKRICKEHNISIYENTKIVNILKEDNKFICQSDDYIIKASKVILALHYPYFLVPYLFPFKVYLEKSHIIAFKTDQDYKYSSITSKNPTISTRFYKDKNVYKIFLSNSHNLAFNNNDNKNFCEVITKANAKPDYAWSNKDIITSDKIPLIGEIKHNLFLATGYNTWGMTNGSIAGEVIKDLVLGKQNKYQSIFDPKRGINKNSFIKFPITLTSTVKSFVGSKVNKNKSWYKESVEFTNDLGIFTDPDGTKHIVYNKCPHMNCSLIFNEVEKTWDCPCHGSRFNIDGKSIEGPANYDISYKKET